MLVLHVHGWSNIGACLFPKKTKSTYIENNIDKQLIHIDKDVDIDNIYIIEHNGYITCIADSRDMPELAREPDGVDGGRFILLTISYLLNN